VVTEDHDDAPLTRLGGRSMAPLADRRCVPCKGGVPPLTSAGILPLLGQLAGWTVVDNHHLEKTYRFRDFADALGFVNRVGALAEEQDHHPDIYLAWGRVDVRIWTHKIDGLTESDFIFAAKCDTVPRPGG
jgi:4a-hydroxytetrahydrobiopterin dehydratase